MYTVIAFLFFWAKDMWVLWGNRKNISEQKLPIFFAKKKLNSNWKHIKNVIISNGSHAKQILSNSEWCYFGPKPHFKTVRLGNSELSEWVLAGRSYSHQVESDKTGFSFSSIRDRPACPASCFSLFFDPTFFIDIVTTFLNLQIEECNFDAFLFPGFLKWKKMLRQPQGVYISKICSSF